MVLVLDLLHGKNDRQWKTSISNSPFRPLRTNDHRSWITETLKPQFAVHCLGILKEKNVDEEKTKWDSEEVRFQRKMRSSQVAGSFYVSLHSRFILAGNEQRKLLPQNFPNTKNPNSWS